MDDKMVEWLFKHPLSDGGQFTGVSDIIEKYGLVPRVQWWKLSAVRIPER